MPSRVRNRRGNIQFRVAAAETGISPKTLSRIERGFPAAKSTLMKLRQWLDTASSEEPESDQSSRRAPRVTPLHWAVFDGSPARVWKLLIQGEEPCAVNDMDDKPLHFCSNAMIARQLIKASAAIDARDCDGWTPLIAAASHGYASVVAVLLDNKADPNAESHFGETALAIAVRGAHLDVVEMLLSAGAKAESNAFVVVAEIVERLRVDSAGTRRRMEGPSKHRRYIARHKVSFFTQWLSAGALNEAKKSLGSSNKSVDVA